MNAKLHDKSWCQKCLGCNKLEDKNFSGKSNCSSFKPADKKVWCADEAVKKYNTTGKISR